MPCNGLSHWIMLLAIRPVRSRAHSNTTTLNSILLHSSAVVTRAHTAALPPTVTVVQRRAVLVYAAHDMASTSRLRSCSSAARDVRSCFSCGTIGAYCAYQKSSGDKQPASLEGEFKAQAIYYNETKVSSQYSTCGTEREKSLDENNEKIYAAALNQVQFDPYTVDGIPSTNPICQKKAIVKGPKGQVTVRFVDRCPDCKEGTIEFPSLSIALHTHRCFILSFAGDLALTQNAFIAVAGELGAGFTNVEWHFI